MHPCCMYKGPSIQPLIEDSSIHPTVVFLSSERPSGGLNPSIPMPPSGWKAGWLAKTHRPLFVFLTHIAHTQQTRMNERRRFTRQSSIMCTIPPIPPIPPPPSYIAGWLGTRYSCQCQSMEADTTNRQTDRQPDRRTDRHTDRVSEWGMH